MPNIDPKMDGLPLVDATEGLTVKLKNIDRIDAEMRNPGNCVVSKAVQRHLGDDVVGVRIGARMAYVNYGDHVKRFVVSCETSDMIRAYDLAGYFPVGVTAKLLPIPPSRILGKASGGHTPKKERTMPSSTPVVASRPWLRHLHQSPTSSI